MDPMNPQRLAELGGEILALLALLLLTALICLGIFVAS